MGGSLWSAGRALLWTAGVLTGCATNTGMRYAPPASLPENPLISQRSLMHANEHDPANHEPRYSFQYESTNVVNPFLEPFQCTVRAVDSRLQYMHFQVLRVSVDHARAPLLFFRAHDNAMERVQLHGRMLQGLDDGAHTLTAIVEDAAGKWEAQGSFSIDTQVPTAVVERTPSGTYQITCHDASGIRNLTVAVAWTGMSGGQRMMSDVTGETGFFMSCVEFGNLVVAEYCLPETVELFQDVALVVDVVDGAGNCATVVGPSPLACNNQQLSREEEGLK